MPPAIVTDNLVAHFHAARANHLAPGENVTPLATWHDLAGANDGTLTGFGYTTASGWAGSGRPADPYCLVDVNYSNAPGMFAYPSWVSAQSIAVARMYSRVLTPAEVAQNYAAGMVWLAEPVFGPVNALGRGAVL